MKYKYLLTLTNFMSITNIKLFLVPILAISAAFLFQTIFLPSHVSAISYNYTTYPMNDSVFTASFTMSAAQIQTFLQNEGSGLATFSDIENCGSTTGPNYTFYSTYYHCGSSESAAQIIYDASQAYEINPQVIIATMQKEQSLITTPNPIASQLNYAMGYGCPDSASSCSVSGFFNQVDNGTWQFRADIDLMNGISYWGYSPSSYPCNGASSFYSAALKPGNNVTFYDSYGNAYTTFVIPNSATAALYCYTPHVFPGSSAQYYSGSYWFVYYFSLWFGGSTTPYAFVANGSATVYLFVDGYKVSVPSMAILQDYGVDPASIQVLSQSAVNNIPSPSLSANNISPSLSSIISTVGQTNNYLVTVGQKYLISTSQFNDFGFSTNQIAYMPSDFIASINGSQNLSNYIQTPTNNIFQVTGGYKHIIFNFSTYQSLNPSGNFTPVSYYVSNLIASSIPITNSPILIQNTEGSVFLLTNNSYYAITSMDVYNCTGLNSALNIPLYALSSDSFIGSINSTLNFNNCLVNNGSSVYLLNQNMKYLVPTNYIPLNESLTMDQNMQNIINQLPTSSQPITEAIKSTNSSTVYYLTNGIAKIIPSLTTLNMLGISQIDTLNQSSFNSIPLSGIILADGQLVKGDQENGVYIISGNSRVAFKSASDFNAYHFTWNNIEVIPQILLDQNYPPNNTIVQNFIYDFANNTSYLADSNGCYVLGSSDLTNFNTTVSQIINNSQYTGQLYRNINLATCGSSSNYILNTDTGSIYLLKNGVLYPFPSWTSFVNFANNLNPYLMKLSSSALDYLPTGPSI